MLAYLKITDAMYFCFQLLQVQVGLQLRLRVVTESASRVYQYKSKLWQLYMPSGFHILQVGWNLYQEYFGVGNGY